MKTGAQNLVAANKGADKLWIVIGDIHGDMGNFERIPELSQASGIIISGDLTNLGGSAAAKKVMDAITKLNLPVFAQIGNMDKPEVDKWLSEQGCNIHGTVRELDPEIAIFGVGGSTPTTFNTPSEFSEDMVANWLDEEWQTARKYPHRLLVSHNPPKDTPCDDIGNGVHVGSVAVRDFILKNQPDICACGHIHEGRAKDTLGKTTVLNPGTLADGGYIVLRFRDGALTGELRVLNESR